MRGLEKGQEVRVKITSLILSLWKQSTEVSLTFRYSYFPILILIILLLRRRKRLTWRTNCHVVRVTIMDLFANEVEDFQKDWYALTWTISCREDGNIWVEA